MNKKSEEVINRLMEAYATTDEQTLAVKIGRDVGTLRTWRNRDMVPLTVLVEASQATDYSVDWLKGVPGAQKSARKKTPADDRQKAFLTEREVVLLQQYRELPERLRCHVENSAFLAWLAYKDRKAYHESEAQLRLKP